MTDKPSSGDASDWDIPADVLEEAADAIATKEQDETEDQTDADAPLDTTDADAPLDTLALSWANHEKNVVRWGQRHRIWWAPHRDPSGRYSSFHLGQSYLLRVAMRPGSDLHKEFDRLNRAALDLGLRLGLRPNWAGVVGVPWVAVREAAYTMALDLDENYGDERGAELVGRAVQSVWYRKAWYRKAGQPDPMRAGGDLHRHLMRYYADRPWPAGIENLARVCRLDAATVPVGVMHLLRDAVGSPDPVR